MPDEGSKGGRHEFIHIGWQYHFDTAACMVVPFISSTFQNPYNALRAIRRDDSKAGCLQIER